MTRFLISELRRCFNPAFALAVSAGFLLLLTDCAEDLIMWLDSTAVAADKNAYDIIRLGMNGFFLQFIPLLAVLPYASSLAADRESGYIYSVFARIKRRAYLAVKAFCAFISGALVIALPIALFVLMCNALAVVKLSATSMEPFEYMGEAMRAFITQYGVAWYVTVWLLGCAAFGAMSALLGLIISTWTTHRLLIFTMPVLCAYLLNSFLPRVGLISYRPNSFGNATALILDPAFFGIYAAAFIAALALLGWAGMRRHYA